MQQERSEEFMHRCGHCLFAIKRMQAATGNKLICLGCGAETIYREAAFPQAVALPANHTCDHIIHTDGDPLLKLLLFWGKPARKRRRSSMD
jgi:hypothetical protein